MNTVWGFLIGCALAGPFGLLVGCVLAAASRANEEERRIARRYTVTDGQGEHVGRIRSW